MQFAGWYELWKITTGAENFVFRRWNFTDRCLLRNLRRVRS